MTDQTKTIYVVIGSSGEHEDYRTWPVAAFTFRHIAERFASQSSGGVDVGKASDV